MAFWRTSVEVSSKPLMEAGILPPVFFQHNECLEILRVYAFQPRERLLLARITRSGPAWSAEDIARRRDALRRRYHLRDFEIVDVGADGRTYVALLRQENPGILEELLQELGAGVTPTTPTVLRKDSATLTFIADRPAERRIFALLEHLDIPWKLRTRSPVRTARASGEVRLTARQQEILSLAWSLGYFEIPARADLARLATLTGLSRNTVSQHLRRALRRILEQWAA